MQPTAPSLRLPVFLIAALAAMLIGALAFVGWAQHGSSIFLAMAEGTLSWCM
ncbi:MULTISPECIES: hypothetical protein [unclassified Rhizobium]|uniref:hypothetical protein n=1 Tax=unclassified Rhizobium TaxID=2613769 RepID=UPI001AE6ADB8|nr:MULTISPECIES: hypothetical protein [unclassified Rhizobium]MBP2461519.1 hypothetical protein [Rhizobium sp. PvP014]MBP2528914.1 hypothetical protein [Rhizobium sp. PvP099]